MSYKQVLLYIFSIMIISPACHAFTTTYNSTSAFERRFNVNSFILNSIQRYKRYKQKKQPLGASAIKQATHKKRAKTITTAHKTV